MSRSRSGSMVEGPVQVVGAAWGLGEPGVVAVKEIRKKGVRGLHVGDARQAKFLH